MSEKKTTTSFSIGIEGLLGVVFVTLKLTHAINWSWWWVTLPFWGSLAIIALILLVGAITIAIYEHWKS